MLFTSWQVVAVAALRGVGLDAAEAQATAGRASTALALFDELTSKLTPDDDPTAFRRLLERQLLQ